MLFMKSEVELCECHAYSYDWPTKRPFRCVANEALWPRSNLFPFFYLLRFTQNKSKRNDSIAFHSLFISDSDESRLITERMRTR